jgi:hypothetical protein
VIPYTESCRLFLEGKIEEAVERIYDIPGAKEEKYKGNGVQKVKDYVKNRYS